MVAISVVMPVYDAEAYVDAAVLSIRDQTCEDFEFLIYDDGSTDRSAEIVEAHAERDSRIRFARKDHRGLTPWLCEGVAEARGEFVARMDADDVARPERFARQLAYMRAHPECVAVGGEVLLIDPDGWPLRIQGVALGHEEIETALLRGRGEAIVHPVALFRHAALKTVGGYRTECEPAEDLDLYLRLAHHGRLANLPETLLEYRQHPKKVSHARGAEQREMVNAVLREARRRRGLSEGDVAPLPPAVVANAADCHREWTRLALEGHHLATARKHARAALRAEPGNRRSWQLWVLAWLGLPVETVKRALRGAGSER